MDSVYILIVNLTSYSFRYACPNPRPVVTPVVYIYPSYYTPYYQWYYYAYPTYQSYPTPYYSYYYINPYQPYYGQQLRYFSTFVGQSFSLNVYFEPCVFSCGFVSSSLFLYDLKL